MPASEVISQISAKYEKAKESGDLLFYPSTVVVHNEPGINVDFQIRVCPALQKKPQQPASLLVSTHTADAEPPAGSKNVSDPFAPPYNTNLVVGELKDENSGEEYVVFLNKFSVVPHHFLLVSKEHKSQSSPLLPPDLVQTYKILMAARKAGKKLCAFYNCGAHSGASQSHKHIQFLPLDEGEAEPPIERLARSTNLETPTKPFTISKLPYANHVSRLPPDLQYENDETLEGIFADIFLSLVDLVVSTIRHSPEYPAGKPSYNVIVTLEHIHLIPRRHGTHTLESGGEVNVNALGFAGMLLVKSDDELEGVRKEGIGKILRGVGLGSVQEVQIAGITDEVVDLTASSNL